MSQIVPVDVSTVSAALKALLLAHPEVGGQGVTIERGARPNEELQASGWIGIYRQSVRLEPRTLGTDAGSRRQYVELVLLVQEQHAMSGEDCEDKLESLLQRTMGAILSDGSLGGTVDMVGEIEVRYTDYLRNDSTSMYVQTAALYVPGIVMTR